MWGDGGGGGGVRVDGGGERRGDEYDAARGVVICV